MSWGFLGLHFCHIYAFILSPVRIKIQGLQVSSLLNDFVNFHLLWQRAFSPEGLSEMWNEMVIDEEITFNREESAHTGTVENNASHHYLCCFFKNSFFFLTEDCPDCFGTQKKDEPNDKEKKEDEDMLTSVHHSIIETWDWGRQPGEGDFLRKPKGCKGSESGPHAPLFLRR